MSLCQVEPGALQLGVGGFRSWRNTLIGSAAATFCLSLRRNPLHFLDSCSAARTTAILPFMYLFGCAPFSAVYTLATQQRFHAPNGPGARPCYGILHRPLIASGT